MMAVEVAAGVRTGMGRLIRELRELEDWPEVEVDAGLLLWDVLRAIGFSQSEAVELLGFDGDERAVRWEAMELRFG